MDATQVCPTVITSSWFPTPHAASDAINADVPLDTGYEYLAPVRAQSASSRS